jgi:preprotein translocase SecE subunit
MPIVAADLKFLSSERMIDALAITTGSVGGGGFAAGPVLQDGVVGNVFPPAGPSDLVAGRRRIRLVYPAVLSNENSRALAAGAAVFFTSETGRQLIAFGRDAVREVKKVVWPERKEAMQITAYVFAFVVVMALFLWLTDKTLEWVFYDLILGWKK